MHATYIMPVAERLISPETAMVNSLVLHKVKSNHEDIPHLALINSAALLNYSHKKAGHSEIQSNRQ